VGYSLFNWFTKITAYPFQIFALRKKILYEDKAVQGRRLKGSAIIISNHTSVFDYAVMLFVFFGRTLRYQMAELLFEKKLLALFLRCMGGIYVNRNTKDLSFIAKSADIIEKGGVVGVFPEGRLPKKGEIPPLPYTASGAYLALQTGVKVIPVYTNGSYFKKKRTVVAIGTPIYPEEVECLNISDKEKIQRLTDIFKERIIALGNSVEKYEKENFFD